MNLLKSFYNKFIFPLIFRQVACTTDKRKASVMVPKLIEGYMYLVLHGFLSDFKR